MNPGLPPHFDPAVSRMNAAVLEFMFETTRTIAGLVLSGRKSRFENIRIVADRLVMGFDYPMMPPATIAPEIGSFEAFSGLQDNDGHAIRRGNALSLFPRLAA